MDVILYWNDIALEANRISHTTGQDSSNNGPTRSSRALGIVHLAMYDAYARAKGNPVTLPAYNPAIPPAPSGVVAQSAAAGAAHRALTLLYPSLAGMFLTKMATSPGSTDGPSLAYGAQVADMTVADRAADPDASNMGYSFGSAKDSHQQDPDNPSPNSHGPKYGMLSKGFAITARHQLDPYPALGSSEFNDSLRQVKAKGIAPELAGTVPNASYRTPEETIIGLYWGYDGASGLGTPPRLYNQIIRQVAVEKGNSESKNARLFALVNVAMADAGILAWEQKYRYNLMRPVVGVREGDVSLGKSTVGNNDVSPDCDVNWLPFGAPKTNETGKKNFTPPFPAYPSGHATFGAAAFQIARLFYDSNAAHKPDNLLNGKFFVSDELNGQNKDNKGTVRPKHNRNFPDGLWQMIIENGFSRVFLGVHWSFDAFALDATGNPDLNRNIGGVPLGLTIAKDIFTSGMKKSNVGPSTVV